MIIGVRGRLDVRVAAEFCQQFGFIPDFDIDTVDIEDGVRFARIDAALEDFKANQFAFGNAEPLQDCGAYLVFLMQE